MHFSGPNNPNPHSRTPSLMTPTSPYIVLQRSTGVAAQPLVWTAEPALLVSACCPCSHSVHGQLHSSPSINLPVLLFHTVLSLTTCCPCARRVNMADGDQWAITRLPHWSMKDRAVRDHEQHITTVKRLTWAGKVGATLSLHGQEPQSDGGGEVQKRKHVSQMKVEEVEELTTLCGIIERLVQSRGCGRPSIAARCQDTIPHLPTPGPSRRSQGSV